jgi:hypothetical protein
MTQQISGPHHPTVAKPESVVSPQSESTCPVTDSTIIANVLARLQRQSLSVQDSQTNGIYWA